MKRDLVVLGNQVEITTYVDHAPYNTVQSRVLLICTKSLLLNIERRKALNTNRKGLQMFAAKIQRLITLKHF